MRRLYHDQLPLMPIEARHPRAAELAEMSRLLDALPKKCLTAVQHDLCRRRKVSAKRGREGLSAEQVLRAAVAKRMFKASYDELAFHLEDSLQLRSFCRMSPSASAPKKSALQENISAIRPETMEAVNRALVFAARERKVEDGRWMRTDTTVVEANIHHPLDSALLWDGVRVLTRIMIQTRDDFGTSSCNHARRAKRRSIGILNARTTEKRLRLYKDLLKVTHKTCSHAEKVIAELEEMGGPDALLRADSLKHFLPLVSRVIEQTERRVLKDETVPASEKLVSIFEPHTDIIRKDRRDTYYGHKVTLSTGKSGLVLDVVVEAGNPADSTLAVRSTERHAALFGCAPEQAAFDGGFASKANVDEIKQAGTTEVCFAKPVGIPIEAMTSTPRIRRTLKRFRVGIEASISFLKRSFGLSRITSSGLPQFRADVWCSALAHNLLVLARHLLGRSNQALA